MIRKNMKFLSQIFCTVLLFTGLARGAAFQFGGLRLDKLVVTSSSSTIVLTSGHRQVNVSRGSANQVYNLPNATTLQEGYWYEFINEGTGTLKINNSSSVVITTLTAASSPAAATSARLYLTSNGTTGGPWAVAGTTAASTGGTFGTWTSYTPTISSFGSVTAVTFQYKQLGDLLIVKGTFTAGTLTGSDGVISLPSGFTIKTSALPIPSALANNSDRCSWIGHLLPDGASQKSTLIACGGTSTSNIYLGRPLSVAGVTVSAAPSTYLVSSLTQVEFEVPIN